MPVSFLSLEFFVFVVLALVFVAFLPTSKRTGGILFASVIFIFLFHWFFLLLALGYGVINFVVGKKLNQNKNIGYWYWLGQTINIGLIAGYKLLSSILPMLEIDKQYPAYQYLVLPLGISYYAFQSISYLYLVRKRCISYENNPIHLLLYLTFFPKFLAGPIERPSIFMRQLKNVVAIDSENWIAGGRLFLWGALKKVLIANTFGVVVNKVHGNPSDFAGIPTYLAFALQSSYIYFDFSGYTDMALGLGRIFGIRLSPNFNLPFKAQTVGEFWRKWHITLSAWCNNFVYNRIILRFRHWNKTAVVFGILSTFIIIGLWHGISLNFFILGLIQGIAIVYEFFTRRYRLMWSKKFFPCIYPYLSMALVHFVFSFSLVFFYAKSFDGALVFFDQLFSFHIPKSSFFGINLSKIEFFMALLGACAIYCYEYSGSFVVDKLKSIFFQYRWLRWVSYWVALSILVYYSKNNIVFSYAAF